MSVVDGFIFFKDWEKSMRMLPPEDFMSLFWAMYDFQMYGKPFPEFEGLSSVIASFIAPQLKRRMANAVNGKRGAEAKWSGEPTRSGDENTPKAMPKASPDILPKNSPMAYRVDIREDKDIDVDIDREKKTDAEGDARAEESDRFMFEEERRYGKLGNVRLSDEEYSSLRSMIPDVDGYIDMFSEKLSQRGYRYSNHFRAICDWWEHDKALSRPIARSSQGVPEQREDNKSFSTDSFFEAAVRRSLGIPLDEPLPDMSPQNSYDPKF